MSDSLRILVIDDDPVMRELLEAVLGFAGHTVETVESGDIAVVQLEAMGVRPDVVLTDLHMPGLQGHALASRLLGLRTPGTVLVGMSGSYPSEEEKRLLDYFLQKPFSPEQFEEALRVARTQRTGGPQAMAPEAADGTAVLDEAIFTRLAETLPNAQLRELYTLTLDDVQGRVTRMLDGAASGEIADVRREAHAIKGSCGMVGARELYSLAATTEGGTAADTMPLALFAPACERLKRMLDERLTS